MYFYIPISCFLGYFAVARGFIVGYLFVHRAKIAKRRGSQITHVLDALADRNANQKYSFEFPMMTYPDYKEQFHAGLQDLKEESETNTMLHTFEPCPICCDEVKDEDRIVYLPCNVRHVFHQHCILLWLQKNESCPLCKTEVISFDNIE